MWARVARALRRGLLLMPLALTLLALLMLPRPLSLPPPPSRHSSRTPPEFDTPQIHVSTNVRTLTDYFILNSDHIFRRVHFALLGTYICSHSVSYGIKINCEHFLIRTKYLKRQNKSWKSGVMTRQHSDLGSWRAANGDLFLKMWTPISFSLKMLRAKTGKRSFT